MFAINIIPLLVILSTLLTVFGAYCFFCAGINYADVYTTGALIPFRNDAVKAGIAGAVALVFALTIALFL